MFILFFLLTGISIIALIIGLINPRFILKFISEEKRDRKNVLKVFGSAALVSFILMFITVGSSDIEDEPVAKEEEIEEVEEEVLLTLSEEEKDLLKDDYGELSSSDQEKVNRIINDVDEYEENDSGFIIENKDRIKKEKVAFEEKEKEDQEEQEVKEKEEKKKQEQKEAKEKEEAKEEEEAKEKEEAKEEVDAYADMKGEIIGKSDKSIKDIKNINPRDVRNDTTGNWKITTMSDPIKIEEYALSYAKEHIKKEEVHFIVNFTNKTTTRINDYGVLYVTIMEYVKKEEHDANDLGNGMVLADYIIYPDGDIEDIME